MLVESLLFAALTIAMVVTGCVLMKIRKHVDPITPDSNDNFEIFDKIYSSSDDFDDSEDSFDNSINSSDSYNSMNEDSSEIQNETHKKRQLKTLFGWFDTPDDQYIEFQVLHLYINGTLMGIHALMTFIASIKFAIDECRFKKPRNNNSYNQFFNDYN